MLSALAALSPNWGAGMCDAGQKAQRCGYGRAFGPIGIMSKLTIEQTTEQIRSAGKNFQKSIISPIRTLAIAIEYLLLVGHVTN